MKTYTFCALESTIGASKLKALVTVPLAEQELAAVPVGPNWSDEVTALVDAFMA